MTERTKFEVSVVIPAFNGERFLADCLDSLRQHTSVPHEVILVDNGSRDSTTQIVGRYPEVKVIRNLVNNGFAYAVNRGMQASGGAILFLLNQDTVVTSDWFTPVVERMRSDNRIGIVGCRLLYPDGTVQHAGGRITEPTFDTEHLRDDEAGGSIDYVTGAAVAIRRSCFESVGSFDEGFFPAYFEDVDYCLRAQALGWRVVYEPRSVLTHFESYGREGASDFPASAQAQRLRLMLKHRSSQWIHDNYLPYERGRVSSSSSAEWLLAIAQSCLAVASEVSALVQWRREFYGDNTGSAAVVALLAVLFEIRTISKAAAERLMFGVGLKQVLDELRTLLPGPDPWPKSALPLVGPLVNRIQGLRRLAHWSVQRQRAYDAAVLEALRVTHGYLERMSQLDMILERDLQETIRRSQVRDMSVDRPDAGAADPVRPSVFSGRERSGQN